MRLILQYLRRHIGIFLLSTLFLTMEAMADLLQPTLMSFIVDKGVANSDISQILHYGMIMLLIALVGAVSAVMRSRFASRTSQTIGKEMRQDIYHNVQQLSLENIDRLQPASIITRITNDVSQIQDLINSIMRMMVKAPITCVGAIVLILIQTPRQAPVMIGIIAVVAFLIFGNMRIGYPRFGVVQKKLDKLNGVTREFLSAVRVVKAFNAEDEETAKFDRASTELANANTAALRIVAAFSPLINLTVNFGIILLLWISKNQNGSEIGKLMASVNYMTQVLFAVTMISNVINVAVRAMASSGRIQEVLNEKPAQQYPEHPLRPDIKGEITFENVSFAYAGAGKETLKGINFKISPGETVGIIGPTGSGKTTLVNLVPRLYDVSEGRILIDGCDVTQIDETLLRSSVAVAAQKALLFTGSIRDNLRWGREDAGDEEIQAAARTACADEFILKTDKGYDTWLEQGGVNLSGGQKQRLSLARALVRNPRILILDDCTSALDAQTEADVLNRMREHFKGLTVLLISQRISTVMRADKILCLENGSVQGFGTHEQLMENSELYRAVFESQIGGRRNGR
ncbi:ATP-binding cassette domain-containing protein [Clostridium sp. MCC353]|uniref:ABC transporter ATP-binding protein n=1 Tax=Clostridium sp. MCC353 TaxID=2592646 RepID=UPI001C02C2A8|nr:ABC transporter ATP-binding protein [Clostridium sp. MCC353]MBT9778892.1 ATP-binding cassette domain-containing protein [Clostridium sp. MCC353]